MSDTRDKILESADRLLRGRGFTGFSYQDIARPLGIRNAAVHYHFPTKADLAIAIIEHYRDLLRCRTASFMAGHGDPVAQLEGFIAFSSAEFRAESTMCPVGALSSDFDSLPESIRQAGRRLLDETIAWMTKVCADGRAQGRMRFEGDPEAKAQQIIASLQGARQMARFRGSQVIHDVAAQIRLDLGIVTPRDG
jgi:TetR/AcrR family transcriptional regulator, transcriptional repressor for nem operon